ncbi:hypothetical protein Tco_0905905, partial [Tanacetum coccineum]
TRASISFDLTNQIEKMCEEPASRDIYATVENEQDGNLMEAEVVDVVAPSQDTATSVENQGQVVDVVEPS